MRLTTYERHQDTAQADEEERSPTEFFDEESAEDVAGEGAGNPERGKQKGDVPSPVIRSADQSD